MPIDDRGIIFIRHGEPSDVIRSIGQGLRPNETWVYRKEGGGNQLFHFVALRGGHDFNLVSDVLLAVEDADEPEDVLRLLEDLGTVDPRYQLLANRYASSRRDQNDRSRVDDVVMAQLPLNAELAKLTLAALERDTYRPTFSEDIPFYYDLYRFAGSGDSTEVTVALAIPGEHLEAVQRGSEYVYAVRLSLIVVDTVADWSRRADTVQTFRSPRPMASGEFLRAHLAVETPASEHVLHRVLVRDAAHPEHGGIYGGEGTIPDMRGTKLQLSDVVLAAPDSSGRWVRGGVRLSFVPPRQFTAGEPLTLFYEVYRLLEGTPYSTEIEIRSATPGVFGRIRRLFGGGRALRLTFEGQAAPDNLGRVQEARRVTPTLGPGFYELIVKVRNLITGEDAVSERTFEVLEAPTNPR